MNHPRRYLSSLLIALTIVISACSALDADPNKETPDNNQPPNANWDTSTWENSSWQ